jgi:hypothetical protein
MQSLSTLPRAGGSPEVPAPPPPCVFSSPALFSACSQHTGSPALVWCVCRPISTFQRQRHSSRHILHYWSPSSFHLVPVCWQLRRAYYMDCARAMAHRSVPSGFVQRTGCSACGLGTTALLSAARATRLIRAGRAARSGGGGGCKRSLAVYKPPPIPPPLGQPHREKHFAFLLPDCSKLFGRWRDERGFRRRLCGRRRRITFPAEPPKI